MFDVDELLGFGGEEEEDDEYDEDAGDVREEESDGLGGFWDYTGLI